MRLWISGFDEGYPDNFPQIIYKNRVISLEEQAFLTNKIISIFLLTDRDNSKKIYEIKNNKHKLPYRDLHNLILDDTDYEFETEYMVALLNYFHIEF